MLTDAEKSALRRLVHLPEGAVLRAMLRAIVAQPTFNPENARVTDYRLGRQSLAREILDLLEKEPTDGR